MAVAVPKRRSAAPATAPPPSRTTAPKRKAAAAAPARAPKRKAPARKPASRKPRAGAGAVTVPAPARRKPLRKTPGRRAPAKAAPGRTAAKTAPRRAKPASRVAAGGRVIPIAAARTFDAARNLPDHGLVVRMTRGRAWIAVLGVLLVGIVALNVVTLSFAASSSKIDEQISALESENSGLTGRVAQKLGTDRVRHEATAAGLAMPNTEEPLVINAGKGDVAAAAQRLAQLGSG